MTSISTSSPFSPPSSAKAPIASVSSTCGGHVPSGLDVLVSHYICGIDRGNPRQNFSVCCSDDTVYDGSQYGNPYISGCISFCKTNKTLHDFQECLLKDAGYNETNITIDSIYCSGSLGKAYTGNDNGGTSNSFAIAESLSMKSTLKALIISIFVSLALVFSHANV